MILWKPPQTPSNKVSIGVDTLWLVEKVSEREGLEWRKKLLFRFLTHVDIIFLPKALPTGMACAFIFVGFDFFAKV